MAQITDNRQTANWHGLPALFWLSSYVTSHHLAMMPQSGAKDHFYSTVYYRTLNPICEAQRVPKICGGGVQVGWRIELDEKKANLSVKYLLCKKKIMFKSQFKKSSHIVLRKTGQIPMEHLFLHLIVVPLFFWPKCLLTTNNIVSKLEFYGLISHN